MVGSQALDDGRSEAAGSSNVTGRDGAGGSTGIGGSAARGKLFDVPRVPSGVVPTTDDDSRSDTTPGVIASTGGSVSAGGSGMVAEQDTAGESSYVPEPRPPRSPTVYPACPAPILEDWSEPLGEDEADDSKRWRVEFGDPRVDTENHRLVLSYDDVAGRTAGYDGGYYVESIVNIPGTTAFTPYPYADWVRLPSLRRTASGDGIELGATWYGMRMDWTQTGWGAASGQVILGTTRARVGAYVQAESKAFALKVNDGRKVYRSEWVTDFHWAGTDLSIMRYVGENNSGVYDNPMATDLIYVNQITGCQKLSDAEVKELFEQ